MTDLRIAHLLDYVAWSMPVVVGALFVWGAAFPKKKDTKVYLRIMLGIVGIWVLYVGGKHLILLNR